MTKDEFRKAINDYASIVRIMDNLSFEASDKVCGEVYQEARKIQDSLMECYDQMFYLDKDDLTELAGWFESRLDDIHSQLREFETISKAEEIDRAIKPHRKLRREVKV